MTERRRVLLRPVDEPQYRQVVGIGDLRELLDVLEVYGPEPYGFAVEIAPGFQVDLPDRWAVEQLDGSTGHAITGP